MQILPVQSANSSNTVNISSDINFQAKIKPQLYKKASHQRIHHTDNFFTKFINYIKKTILYFEYGSSEIAEKVNFARILKPVDEKGNLITHNAGCNVIQYINKKLKNKPDIVEKLYTTPNNGGELAIFSKKLYKQNYEQILKILENKPESIKNLMLLKDKNGKMLGNYFYCDDLALKYFKNQPDVLEAIALNCNQNGDFFSTPYFAVKALENKPEKIMQYFLSKNAEGKTPLTTFRSSFETVEKMHNALKDEYPNELYKIYMQKKPSFNYNTNTMCNVSPFEYFLGVGQKYDGWEKIENQRKFYDSIVDFAKSRNLPAEKSVKLLREMKERAAFDIKIDKNGLDDYLYMHVKDLI